jgi:AcrR family transcriptional regulator
MERRRVGRPSRGARAALLAAAEQQFAEHGYAGARVDQIAQVAGFNKSLILQYFGGKAELYAAVLAQTAEQAAAVRRRALELLLSCDAATAAPADLQQALRAALTLIYDFLAERPQLLRILLWAQAERRQGLPPEERYAVDDEPVLNTFFTHLRCRGLLRSDLPAGHLFSAALLQLQALLAAEQLFDRLPDVITAEQRRCAAVTLVAAGLLRDQPLSPDRQN